MLKEMDWKLVLHGNEAYPYPFSITTEDGWLWITRDGVVSDLECARLMTAAPKLLAACKRVLSDPDAPPWLRREVEDAVRAAQEETP